MYKNTNSTIPVNENIQNKNIPTENPMTTNWDIRFNGSFQVTHTLKEIFSLRGFTIRSKWSPSPHLGTSVWTLRFHVIFATSHTSPDKGNPQAKAFEKTPISKSS